MSNNKHRYCLHREECHGCMYVQCNARASIRGRYGIGMVSSVRPNVPSVWVWRVSHPARVGWNHLRFIWVISVRLRTRRYDCGRPAPPDSARTLHGFWGARDASSHCPQTEWCPVPFTAQCPASTMLGFCCLVLFIQWVRVLPWFTTPSSVPCSMFPVAWILCYLPTFLLLRTRVTLIM